MEGPTKDATKNSYVFTLFVPSPAHDINMMMMYYSVYKLSGISRGVFNLPSQGGGGRRKKEEEGRKEEERELIL